MTVELLRWCFKPSVRAKVDNTTMYYNTYTITLVVDEKSLRVLSFIHVIHVYQLNAANKTSVRRQCCVMLLLKVTRYVTVLPPEQGILLVLLFPVVRVTKY